MSHSGVLELLDRAEALGIQLKVSGEKVKAIVPKTRSLEVSGLLEELREQRAAVAQFLREGPTVAQCRSPDCAGCYEITPSVRIHPPRPSAEWLARWKPGKRDRTQ